MGPSGPVSVALRFNEKINDRDLESLAALMTDDHTFVDKLGNVRVGKAAMKEGWRGFFESYKDYRNVFTNVRLANDGSVVMVGHSVCSYKPLHGPALWRATVREGRVSEWRVYEDTPENRGRLGVPAPKARSPKRR